MGCAVPVEVLPVPRRLCRFMAWPSSPGTLHRSIRRASARTPGNGCAPGRFTAWKSGYPMACRVDLPPASRSSALWMPIAGLTWRPRRIAPVAFHACAGTWTRATGRTLAGTARRAIVAGIGKASRRPGRRRGVAWGRQSRGRAGNPCRFIRRAVHHGNHRQDRREAWQGVRRGNRGTSAPKTGGATRLRKEDRGDRPDNRPDRHPVGSRVDARTSAGGDHGRGVAGGNAGNAGGAFYGGDRGDVEGMSGKA